MNERPIRITHAYTREAPKAFRACLCAISSAFAIWLSLPAAAQNRFTDYSDVQHLLPFLTDVLPPELKIIDTSDRGNGWQSWVTAHDTSIRRRLLRGEEDTIVHWLLFGTSFTKEPRAFFDVPATSGNLPRLISGRTRDLIVLLASRDPNERSVFARELLRSKGYGLATAAERSDLERHLLAEVDRVIAERKEYVQREESFPRGDVIEKIMVGSRLFRDRGLSFDTSILAGFAVEQALETIQKGRLLLPNSVRRVALIGPGLDFADKNSGYDFYPVQTMQPFTSMDSIIRLGLAADADEIELTTFDISPRVNAHMRAIRDRANSGTPYLLRLAADLASQWTPGLVGYWKSIGDRIGTQKPLPKPPDTIKGIDLRGIEVRADVAARVTPMDFNVVTQKWTGAPFDLVIATNVFVYYDRLDQALAFAGIEAMLRPGGFFITNNVIVELPVSRMRSVGIMTVRHSAEMIDHMFWYRKMGS